MIQKLATISTRHSFKSGVNEAEDAEQAGQEKLWSVSAKKKELLILV